MRAFPPQLRHLELRDAYGLALDAFYVSPLESLVLHFADENDAEEEGGSDGLVEGYGITGGTSNDSTFNACLSANKP
jgi:hypothetical protein